MKKKIRKIHRANPPKNILSLSSLSEAISLFLSQEKSPLLAIVGPTASGKTSVSLRIAAKYNGEIINADSRQFYREMNKGTAKITSAEMQNIPHHLLDFLDPDEECSVALFQKLAEEKRKEICSRKKIPLVVGGTGLFVDALRKNFSIPHVLPQKEWRYSLENTSTESLFELLHKKDSVSAEVIDAKNRRRIIRALEVCEYTGKKMSDLQTYSSPAYQTLLIGVWKDPDILEKIIEQRTENIWNSGFLEEVQHLLSAGYTKESPAMIAHGYREAMQFLHGDISKQEAKILMTRNTKRYAKRQRTWWRREKEMLWVDTSL